jgi:hypothetical protein
MRAVHWAHGAQVQRAVRPPLAAEGAPPNGFTVPCTDGAALHRTVPGKPARGAAAGCESFII